MPPAAEATVEAVRDAVDAVAGAVAGAMAGAVAGAMAGAVARAMGGTVAVVGGARLRLRCPRASGRTSTGKGHVSPPAAPPMVAELT